MRPLITEKAGRAGLLLAAALAILAGCNFGEKAAYRYKAGETYDYKFWLTQQIERPEEPALTQRVLFTFLMRIRADRLDPSGEADLSIILSDIHALLSTSEGRRPIKQFEDLNAVGLKMRQAADGRILSLAAEGNVPDGLRPTVESVKRALRELLPTLPNRLTQGTSWARSVAAPEEIPPFGVLEAKTGAQFEAGPRTVYAGTAAVEIGAHFTIEIGDDSLRLFPPPAAGAPAAPPPPDAMQVGFRAAGSGSGKIYFDEKSGRLAGANYDTVVTVVNRTLRNGSEERGVQIVRSHIEVALAARTGSTEEPK